MVQDPVAQGEEDRMKHFDTVAAMVTALQGLDYGERFTLGTVIHEVVKNSPGWPEKKCIRPIDPEYEARVTARKAESTPTPSSGEEVCACGAGHREGEECFPVEDKDEPCDGHACREAHALCAAAISTLTSGNLLGDERLGHLRSLARVYYDALGKPHSPKPSSAEEVQAAMALARATDELDDAMECCDCDPSDWRCPHEQGKKAKVYDAALLRYRASKPAPSGGRGGA